MSEPLEIDPQLVAEAIAQQKAVDKAFEATVEKMGGEEEFEALLAIDPEKALTQLIFSAHTELGTLE